MHDPFAVFIDDIESMRRSIPSEAGLVRAVASRLEDLNRDPDWLPADARQST